MDPNHDMLYKTDFPLPDRQNNYETAFREAADRLKARDIRDVADRSGAIVIASGQGSALLLPFIGDEMVVTHPDIAVTIASGAGEVPMWEKILTLHYLERATGTGLRGEQAASSSSRAALPMIRRSSDARSPFSSSGSGPDSKVMAAAGVAAGGKRSDTGEHALSFRAFPHVEVIFVLWKGDDEFPPSGSVIFDLSIADYLSTEDVAVLCNMIAVRIMKAAGAA